MKKISFLILLFIAFYMLWWEKPLKNMQETSETSHTFTVKKKSLNSRNIAHVKKKSSEALVDRKRMMIVDKKIIHKIDLKKKSPSTFFEKYFDDTKVKVGKRDYYLTERLRTLPQENYDQSYGAEIFRQQGYIFFEAKDLTIGNPSLFQKNNKSLGIMTGRILLENVSKSDAQEIARKMEVDLDLSMSHLGIYALDAPEGVFSAIQELGESISSAELIEGQIHEK